MSCRQPDFRPLPTHATPGASLALSLLVGLLGLGVASPAAAQAREARQRSLFVSVLDGKNVPVPNIGPEDLVVREDGTAREILTVAPADEPPLDIALLVDDSQASTRHIQRIREALNAFITKVATGQHSISIVTMGDRPTLVVDSTTDPARLKKNGVDKLFGRPSSGMYLLDAINDTAKGFQKREAKRPVIIAVMTEGIEFSNGHYQTTLDALARSGAAFYAIVLTDGREPDPTIDEIRNRNVVLDRGTRESGGRREQVLSDMAIEDTLAGIGNELLHQYTVTYGHPQTLIPPDRVTVEAKKPGITARGQLVRTPADRTGK